MNGVGIRKLAREKKGRGRLEWKKREVGQRGLKERERKGVRGERRSVREQVYKSTSYCPTFFTPSMSVFVDTILDSSPKE